MGFGLYAVISVCSECSQVNLHHWIHRTLKSHLSPKSHRSTQSYPIFRDDTLSPPPFPHRPSHLCYRSFVCVFIGWRSGGGEAMMEAVAAHWSSLNAICPLPQQGPSRDPNALRLPDSMLRLVEPRLSLHLTACNPWSARSSAMARHSVFSATRPTVFTCNATIAAMYRTKKYSEAITLFHFFFNKSNLSSF